MGYLIRRIAGWIVFLVVFGVLSSMVVSANETAGGTLLAGRSGAAIGIGVLLTALIASWTVRWSMRRHEVLMRRARLSYRWGGPFQP